MYCNSAWGAPQGWLLPVPSPDKGGGLWWDVVTPACKSTHTNYYKYCVAELVRAVTLPTLMLQNTLFRRLKDQTGSFHYGVTRTNATGEKVPVPYFKVDY